MDDVLSSTGTAHNESQSCEVDNVERLKGKRAIVTGAASGMGLATAKRLLSEGARVILGYHRLEPELETSYSGYQAYRADVSSELEIQELVQRAVYDWGGLDLMVNNAGVGVAATAVDTTEEQWDLLMDVNLKGTFFGIKYAVPAIAASGGGSVINIGSNAALVGIPSRAAYCASKGGVLALTRAAAIDHISEGVRVNCVLPGTSDTPWIERINEGVQDMEAAREAMRARQVHGRFVAPEEVAATVCFLASEEAASFVGAGLVLDGGMTAR